MRKSRSYPRRVIVAVGFTLALVAALLAGATAPAEAADCSWQNPTTYVSNYQLAATKTSEMMSRPDANCGAGRQISTGQTANIIAEQGAWLYGRNLATGQWGWFHERVFADVDDCSWQNPTTYVSNYNKTALKKYNRRGQPHTRCTPVGSIEIGQTGRVVAESGDWRYLQIQETGRWGWVHKGAFESGGGGSCPAGREMVIVAHADDDIIFMNPTIDDRINAGACVVTVFITAGENGGERPYWSGREDGVRAAHARMQGVDMSSWRETVRSVNGKQIDTIVRNAEPDSPIYFLRLPDGQQGNGVLPGPGTERYGFVSLQKLWDGQISTITAVDGSPSYSRSSLIDTLATIIDQHDPSILHVQDHTNTGNRSDHSDHVHAARYAVAARNASSSQPTVRDYLGYQTSGMEANVTGADLTRKGAIFAAYAAHDPQVHDGGLSGPIGSAYTYGWLPREYRLGQSQPSVGVNRSGFLVGVGENCLDVRGAGSADGTAVQMYDCVNVPAQKWQFMSNGEVRGVHGNCLTVVGGSTANQTPVRMFTCAGLAGQKWTLTSGGELRGTGNNCLDVVGGRTANQTLVQMYDCAGVPAQQWRLSSAPPSQPTVVRSGSLVGVGGKCLDVVGGGTANQTPLQMYSCNNTSAQQWQLMSNGELRGHGGNCLDVVNGQTADQTPVQMYACVGVAAQRWTYSGTELKGIGGNCLDVVNGRTVNGTKVQMFRCANVAAQRWQWG